MQVTVTTDDETGQATYETEGYPVKVVVEPSGNDAEVFVEVWDEAGCQVRELRPADQGHSVAVRTLLGEFRADQAEQAVVAEAV